MREQQLQKKILDYLNKQECTWAVKVINCNKNGTSDILCCYKGQFVAIEVKAPGKLNDVSKIQQYQINKISEAGGIAFAADSLETVKQILAMT